VLSHTEPIICGVGDNPVPSGSAWADYDNDGDVDLFVTDAGGPNHLYRNDGDTDADGLPNFTDVAVTLGIDDATKVSHSCVFIDYDNDGDQDLYVTHLGGNSLYRNQLTESGTATFIDVTSTAKVADAGRAIISAWGDFDRDGYLDFYLARHFVCENDPQTDDQLYHNNGDGTFTNVTSWLCPGGVAPCPETQGSGFSAAWMDYDNDGDLDLYVANEAPQIVWWPNILWRNDGSDGAGGWNFTDVSDISGLGVEVKSMGLGVGDYDNDGWLDVAISDVGSNNLLHALGDGTYEDVSAAAGIERYWVYEDSIRSITWGTVFFDYDNDRLLDLFFVAGAIQNNDRYQPDAFFKNNGDGTFTDYSDLSGLNNGDRGRSASIVDLDNDGFVDVFVGQLDRAPLLYHNEMVAQGNTNHSLTITAQGTVSNRDGIGTRIWVTTPDGVTQMREITSGPTYGGGDYRAGFFGLGSFTSADLSVRWPTGEVQDLGTVAADQVLHLVEGEVAAPIVSDIPDQTIAVGGRFAPIVLDNYVDDPDHSDSEITWSWSGNGSLIVRYDAIRRRIRVRTPQGWIGSETITFVATDPDGFSNQDAATFTVGAMSRGIASDQGETPTATGLTPIHPNPFNPEANIRYSLSEDAVVQLNVYNALGMHIATLVNEFQAAGYKTVTWNGTNDLGEKVSSGVYLARLQTGGIVDVQRMLLVK
jgi:hypothetical protein